MEIPEDLQKKMEINRKETEFFVNLPSAQRGFPFFSFIAIFLLAPSLAYLPAAFLFNKPALGELLAKYVSLLTLGAAVIYIHNNNRKTKRMLALSLEIITFYKNQPTQPSTKS